MSGGRVLHLIEQLGAPSETFLTDRMVELDRLGWEAWAAARGLAETSFVPFPPAERTLVLRRRAAVAARLRAAVGAGRGDAPEWIERGIRRARPDLLHAHFGWNGLAAMASARSHRLPLVVGLHGYDVCVYPHHGMRPPPSAGAESPPRGAAPEEVYEELFSLAASVVVNSRFLERRLRDLGYAHPVDVIPSGIRLEEFPFRGPRSDPGDGRPPCLLYVGRLVEYKGLDTAIHALGGLGDELARARLDVVGEGPQRPAYERLVNELGLQGRVEFHGAGTRAEVVAAFGRADLLVAPARTLDSGQAEALGNVIKEALAVGLEVVATNHGGHPEVLPPERRAELIPEDDPAALSAAIHGRWARRDGWPERARRGRDWVAEHFDWHALAPRLATIYRQAVDQRLAA